MTFLGPLFLSTHPFPVYSKYSLHSTTLFCRRQYAMPKENQFVKITWYSKIVREKLQEYDAQTYFITTVKDISLDSAHLVCTRNAFKMFFTFSGVIITEKLSTKNFRRRGRGNGITNYSTFNFEPQFFHLCLAFFFKSLFVVCTSIVATSIAILTKMKLHTV